MPVIAVTGTAANVAGIVGGIIVFGDPLSGHPVMLAAEFFAFTLVLVAAWLTPAPVRASRVRPEPRGRASRWTRRDSTPTVVDRRMTLIAAGDLDRLLASRTRRRRCSTSAGTSPPEPGATSTSRVTSPAPRSSISTPSWRARPAAGGRHPLPDRGAIRARDALAPV